MQAHYPQAISMYQLLFCLFLASGDIANGPLTMQVEPNEKTDIIEYDKPLHVIVRNAGAKPVSLWKHNTKYGYSQLSFQFTNVRTGEKHLVQRRISDGRHPWGYREVAEAEAISLNETLVIEVNLSSYAPVTDSWSGLPAPNGPDRFRIKAKIDSTDSRQAPMEPVWTGTLASDELEINFVAAQLKMPHDYLKHGFSAKAIEIMEADPNWIKIGDGNRMSPLHFAVRHKCLDAIRWLINAGVNVNGRSDKDIPPLHLADDKDVVALLLQLKGDVNRPYNGRTPVQHAAKLAATSRFEADRRKWHEIALLLLKAGATCDYHSAICLNDLDKLKSILSHSPNLAREFNHHNPLRLAASLGHLEMCRYLIDTYRLDVNDRDAGGGYPILKEALPHPKVVKLLIDHKADEMKPISWQGFSSGPMIIGREATALHYAANDGNPETITLLINAGVDIFALARTGETDEPNQTALEVASYFGKAENALAILRHPKFKEVDAQIRQAVLNKCLVTGAYPSFLASDAKRPELIKVLLEHGADPQAKVDGNNAITVAVESIHPGERQENEDAKKVIAFLREKGVALNLFGAVAIGDEAEVARLIQLNPQCVNDRRSDGYPALHFAVAMNNCKIVALLLKAGADIHLRNKASNMGTMDETPLHAAAFWGHYDMVKLLINAGADVNALNESAMTPLHDATNTHNRDYVKIIKCLLDKCADPDARDRSNNTPLDSLRQSRRCNVTALSKLMNEYSKRK